MLFNFKGGSGPSNNAYKPSAESGDFGKAWKTIAGRLKQVSVGDGKIIGVSNNDGIYVRVGITTSKPHGTGWKRIPGALKYVAVGDGKIMGVNKIDQIYARTGIYSCI